MWHELRRIKSGTKQLKEFGYTVGIVALVLGVFALWRGKAPAPYLTTAGCLLIAFGRFAPALLLPFQKAWMALGLVLGFFVSRIILVILFYGVVTPIGLVMRLLGRDILDERIDRAATTYWKKRAPAPHDPKRYEQQY